MHYTYDEEADAVFLYLVDAIGRGEAKRSAFLPLAIKGGSITTVLDAAGSALGIEFLGASKIFTPGALAGFRAGRTPFKSVLP